MMLRVSVDMTWDAYFRDAAKKSLIQLTMLKKGAAEKGMTFNDDMQKEVDRTVETFSTYAKKAGYSTSAYLKLMYGNNMTMSTFKSILKDTLLASHYQQDYIDSLTYTDEEVETYYNEHKNNFDVADYEYIYFKGTADSTKDADGNTVQATDEEQAAAKETAKATAEEILAAYNSGKSLESIAGNYEKATYYNTTDATYYDGVVGNWLFDDARKDGDTEILEVGTNYYVGLFHSRGREEYKTVDIRHILITPETGTKAQGDEGYEDEQTQLKAAARTKAEEILAQWKSGEATEDSFAQLAMENSADGSKYDGGLYTRVTKGWAVEEFNDWCFDASRKDGDTGIVDTTYGSHVMYFVGYDLPAWAASVTSDLQEKASSEWSTALSENADVQQSDFGMKFVG